MSWLIGLIIAYIGIGVLLAWGLSGAGGQKFTFNKQSIPFIFTWPILIVALFGINGN